MSQHSSTTISGTVEKIITSVDPRETDKVQIGLDNDEYLYREIRIDNELTDKNGDPVRLKQGATVEVTVEATEHSTAPTNALFPHNAKGDRGQF